MNAGARAAWYGLSAAHGRAHLARAVFEGCAFAMRDVVERMRARVPNPGAKLKPGMFARVTLNLGTRDNAILIPEQAVVPIQPCRLPTSVVKTSPPTLPPM